MTFVEAIKSCLGKYITWHGRAPRSEYWFFYLFTVIAILVAMIIDNVLGTTFKAGSISFPYGWFYLLAGLALFLPGLSAAVRRLHDTNRSGWWYWIALVPLAGAIALLVFFCLKGTPGENRYGSDPLSPSADVFS